MKQLRDFAASIIQSTWRMFVCKADLHMYRSAAELIQAQWKGRRLRSTHVGLVVRVQLCSLVSQLMHHGCASQLFVHLLG